jgi:ketosteroid isomerase-like protein
MELTRDSVTKLFSCLATGDTKTFFANVAEDVHWTVMGTHPLAGDYKSLRDFFDHTFARIGPLLREGIRLVVRDVLVDTQRASAVVELIATTTQNNGKPFNNTYCWVCRFDGGKIVEVRAYLDSALIQETIAGNEK